MTAAPPSLEDRFCGCLLGLAIGDAVGAQYEGQSAEFLARRFGSVDALLENIPPNGLYYTDDTQMAIGVAETLIECGAIEEAALCRHFAANYVPHRGYGRGARVILEAMLKGEDHQWWAANHFPGGSFGNGAAMRVAPIGLMFRDAHDVLWEQARLSALPTHVHPLGIEGAQVMALAVALASQSAPLNREELFERLAARCHSLEFSGPLRRAARVSDPQDLGLFGNGIEATSSVVTAIACFALTPHSYEQTIGNAILLGGDTDTIAAMAGAVCGAHLGQSAIPKTLLAHLENKFQGRDYIEELAKKLAAAPASCGASFTETARESTPRNRIH